MDKKDKKDADFQRKLALQSLMECAGMRELKSDLSDQMAYVNSQLDWKGFISESGLCKLNYSLGMKAGLEAVLNVLQGYEDDLVGDNVKSQK